MAFQSITEEYKTAIVRVPGHEMVNGLTTANLGIPDYDLALEQHRNYVSILRKLELDVITLPILNGFPDAHFVEDVAVIVPETAVITRPGAPSRADEVEGIKTTLENFRKIERIKAPGTLDGGDVLILGKTAFIGISERTNQEGADQLGAILSKFGYKLEKVILSEGLHLKSSVNYIGEDLLLMTENFVDEPAFRNFKKILVSPEESYACNTLWINDNLILADGFPETRYQLEDLGLPIHILNMSEMEKLDGGLTCLSLRF